MLDIRKIVLAGIVVAGSMSLYAEVTLVKPKLSIVKLKKEKLYRNPTIGRYGLDYCREYTKECGQPAADAFCIQNGWDYAKSFRIKRDTPPTKTIGDKKSCTHDGCDRIVNVKCAKGTDKDGYIGNPKVEGVALDYCREYGENCGKPAANAFCMQFGPFRSSDFKFWMQSPPTKTVGDKTDCKHTNCTRIYKIKCVPILD